MEKTWFPQQNRETATIALLKNLVFNFRLPISRLTIEKETREHPNFPVLAFEDISQILAKMKIGTIAFKTEIEKLDKTPKHSILIVKEQIEGVKTGSLVLFCGVEGDKVEYLHTRRGWVKESLKDFESKLGNVGLAVDIIPSQAEPDIDAKEQEYVNKRNSNPDLKRVRIFNDFLTDEECKYIIDLSQERFNQSALMGETNIIDDGRTSYTADLVLPNDPVLEAIRKKAAQSIEIPETHFEYFQCVSYESTQEYMNHFDTFDETTERGKETINEHGQRKYTLLVYLNDDFEGGSTYFPNLDIKVEPKKGRVVVFDNLDENEKVKPAVLHAGLPVTTGRKYALNIWVRTKPFRN